MLHSIANLLLVSTLTDIRETLLRLRGKRDVFARRLQPARLGMITTISVGRRTTCRPGLTKKSTALMTEIGEYPAPECPG